MQTVNGKKSMSCLGGIPNSGSSGNGLYVGDTVNSIEIEETPSNVAQVLLDKSLETAEKMTSEEGKRNFLNSMGTALQKAVNTGKITPDEMENIVRTVSNKLYQSTSSGGGTGGGGGR